TQAALSRLSLNQRTSASWSLPEAIKGCLDAGLGAIGIWREQLAEVGLDDACRQVADSGLRVSSLCRRGFFTNPAEAPNSEAQNREAIEEAAALSAATLVLVPGGLPPDDRDLEGARDRTAPPLARFVPYAPPISIEEAAALSAATLVLVPGGLPPDDRDLEGARDRTARAIERLVPYAHEL